MTQIFADDENWIAKTEKMKELFPERRNLHYLWLVVLNGILSQMM